MPKTGIHPTYHTKANVTCSCGATYTIGSTKETLKVDICSACHPFYSGNQKLIDTAGRVDRFRERMAAAQSRQVKPKKEVKKPEPKAETVETETQETEVKEEN